MNNFIDEDFSVPSFNSETDTDVFYKEKEYIDKINKLKEKYNISFVEALEFLKLKKIESLIYSLDEIKTAIYELDRTLMGK